MGIPYAHATTGENARKEITKILRRFGCESIGFMDDFAKHDLVLAFTHRGRSFQFRASAKGWAQMYLKGNPWTYSHRKARAEYEQAALRQGYIAINSAVRDWVKGQVTAIEAGILSFEAVFMPYMLTNDGRTVSERVEEMGLLPSPDSPKVIPLPAK